MTNLRIDAAALLTGLTAQNIRSDVIELLTYGNVAIGVAPGAMEKAVAAARLKPIATVTASVDEIIQELANNSRNAALETAAKLAETRDEGLTELAAAIRRLKTPAPH